LPVLYCSATLLWYHIALHRVRRFFHFIPIHFIHHGHYSPSFSVAVRQLVVRRTGTRVVTRTRPTSVAVSANDSIPFSVDTLIPSLSVAYKLPDDTRPSGESPRDCVMKPLGDEDGPDPVVSPKPYSPDDQHVAAGDQSRSQTGVHFSNAALGWLDDL
jgi:hypothetical protein